VTSSPLNERLRQHYLTQMGVAVWYSRCEMPGAAASPVFDFGDNAVAKESAPASIKSAADILSNLSAVSSVTIAPESNAPEPKALTTPITPATVPAEGMQHALGQEPGITLSTATQSAVVPVFDGPTSSVHVNEAKQENFDELALMLWVGERHWFLSDNDSEFPEVLKQQLLLNIASAIGEKVGGAEVINFNWPFFGNRRLPGNDRASMLSLLQEWVSLKLVSDELTGFLMGERVAQILLQKPLSDSSELNGKKVELSLSDEQGVMVVPTLSINEMLRTPSNKKRVWQHLKPYHIK